MPVSCYPLLQYLAGNGTQVLRPPRIASTDACAELNLLLPLGRGEGIPWQLRLLAVLSQRFDPLLPLGTVTGRSVINDSGRLALTLGRWLLVGRFRITDRGISMTVFMLSRVFSHEADSSIYPTNTHPNVGKWVYISGGMIVHGVLTQLGKQAGMDASMPVAWMHPC